MSSTYIELDSWTYPAVDRLAALGAIDSSLAGLRPWTRTSVYLMIREAVDTNLSSEASELLNALRSEFRRENELESGIENRAVSLDTIYSRSQYISGSPLDDGFHFGQTIVDDFGRPFGQGFQQIAGFEGRAEIGRFSVFARGEYQHSPAVPGFNANVNQSLAAIDGIPGETLIDNHLKFQTPIANKR